LSSSPLPPQRLNRIAVSVFFFLAGLCFSSWASRIPSIQQKLGLNNVSLGGVLLSLPCGLLVSLPLAGWLVARFGSRPIAIGAAILYSAILPSLGFASEVWQLVTALFFFGMAGNMLNISINTQAVGTEALYGRSIMASYHGLWSLAGFSGASVGNLFLGLGWRPWQHFLVITGLAWIMIIVMARNLIVRDPAADEKRPIFARPDRSLINLGIIAFCSMICEGTMFDWSNVYFQKVILPPKALAGIGLTAFMSTMASGRFFGDWVATRLGVRRILQLSGILTASGLLVAILFPWLLPALLGFLLVGAGVSSVVPLVYSAAGRSKTFSPGVALAAVSTLGYLGFLFGPPFIGFIAQLSSLRVSLGLIAILGATIAIYSSRIE
jgi:MFS family permease